jgi:putative DNA-invertase from lambdoid prophage Rac
MHVGRPAALSEAKREAVRKELEVGAGVASLARKYDVSRQTVMRVRDGG